jgi:aminopeptidase N
MKRIIFFLFASVALQTHILSQTAPPPKFTHQDTLRGSITPERSWWDLTYYHLDIVVNPADSTIIGTNTVYYRVLTPATLMQIDLQPPLVLSKAVQNGKSLKIIRDGNAHFIELAGKQETGSLNSVILYYGGRPKIATRPPWEGGITWKRDQNNLPFIASSCQGDGASLWWPCKDHMYDEPDSMLISVNVPANLIDVSNGRLRKVETLKNKTKTYHWFVSNPINNYGVNINIGDYVHFGEKFDGEKGVLDCDYWVLKDNLEKAKVHFKQVTQMLNAFEHWFGPYPFYEDSYKLVDAPYLGMEHQSSITYGNGYQNGYLGNDMSGTGWGNTWDFIIIHESGHEWFANNVTYKDIADMWIHESFINYSESLFVEYYRGKDAGAEYVRGTRRGIRNDRPVTGIYNVNYEGSGDMYPKGGNMLHTLRQIINDDTKWREILRGLNKDFYHQVVDGSQIENYISQKTGMDLKPFFDQYLRDVRIPVFEYYVKDNDITFRWNNCIQRFNMPLKIWVADSAKNINPSTRWTTVKLDSSNPEIIVDKDYYVAVLNMMGR